ncbi:MAG: ATP synthase F0 subunit B [Candidatus Acidiferrales bacterium]
MDILSQLGELFLAAVPTVIIVFLFYFFLRWSFFKPIERILAERHSRAEGARQEAEASRAAVQEKLRAYNEAMRKARSRIFAEQEAARRVVLDERQALITRARADAQKRLQEAKMAIAADLEEARKELDQSSGALANEIAEAILAGRPSGPPSKGAR